MTSPEAGIQGTQGASELHYASALAEAAASVNSSLNFEEVLDRILDQVTRVVPGDTYNIMLIEAGKAHIVRFRGYRKLGIPEAEVRATKTPVSAYPTFAQMVRSGEPIVVPDTRACASWVRKPQRIDHRAYVGAPIRIADRTEGFININSASPERFTAVHAERLRAFANHAAVALRNAQLYREIHHYAEELEQRVAARTRELEARTAWSEAILRSTSDGFAVTDSAGDIADTNPVAARWLDEALQPDDARRLREAIKAVALRASENPERLLALHGVDLELRASIIAAGSPSSIAVVAIHDVTHLRALDRMKSQFISDVSHELRTPITAMMLYINLLKNSPEERQAAYYASLEEELDRLTRLVEGILHIARIEAGRLELKPQPLDLDLLAATAASSHESDAEARGLDIRYRAESGRIVVNADPSWMIRAIDNLIENAVLYTLSGSVEVTTRVEDRSEGPVAVLEVSDTGIGIEPSEVDHVFDRFFRGEEARTRQIPGSGLGLPIVKGIVNIHGGTITVQSAKGKGSTFTVALPLAQVRNLNDT